MYFSKPILDVKSTFDLVKSVSKGLTLDSNIAKEVWAYGGQTSNLIPGSPFISKTQPSNIGRKVIT